MKSSALAFAAFSSLAAVACDRPVQAKSEHQDSKLAAAAPIIDSILPPGEALRRFQSTLTPAKRLSPSIRSRDMLVARFMSAIESADTTTIDRLHISKAEYAFLYFPSSAYSRRPYELPPEVAWLLSEQNSLKGRTRLTRRLRGKSLGFRGYECEAAVTEGENRFWRSCEVTYFDPPSAPPVTKRLFGAIIERAGRYKFLSYANDF